MSEATKDPAATLAIGTWRPQSLRPRRRDLLRLRWRVLILVAIGLLHVLGTRWLLKVLSAGDDAVPDESALVVDFIDAAPRPLLDASPKPIAEASEPPGTGESGRKRERLAAPQPSLPAAPAPSRSPGRSLQLYDSEGRLRLPDDLLEQIDRQVGDQRVFSYQIPRMDDASKHFYRNPVLVYETTRFEQYWQPDQDMLTELLTRLVEATTTEIRIPVPGHPGSTMVCKVSIMAFGGGCGVLTNGADYVGPLDDPDTLSKEEDRQCQAWWEQIIGARTQEVWRKTRSLYEAQCRKPLARQS